MREVPCKLMYLKVLAFGLFLYANAVPADRLSVQEARDLQADGREAATRGVPVMLVFVREGCEYCALLEESYLIPILMSGGYEDKVLIRKVQIESGIGLTDFEGGDVEPHALASRYGVSLVPTLLFVDAQGRELAERMVGLTTPDFYGGYLDQSIETALGRLRDGSAP